VCTAGADGLLEADKAAAELRRQGKRVYKSCGLSLDKLSPAILNN
jgi:hypothetical protein